MVSAMLQRRTSNNRHHGSSLIVSGHTRSLGVQISGSSAGARFSGLGSQAPRQVSSLGSSWQVSGLGHQLTPSRQRRTRAWERDGDANDDLRPET